MEKNINTEFLKAESGELGLITLDRTKALNALNYEMISEISNFLDKAEKNEKCFAVVIQGKGEKAFCAGGDIKSVYQNGKENKESSAKFFELEYNMNSKIHNFKKPYIALMHGITMGGGLGISAHGTHRVASSNLTLAMPETGIGFFPDIGGTYFLSRMNNETGTYLGLTGDRINYLESMYAGIVNYNVEKKNFNTLIEDILGLKETNVEQINKAILNHQPSLTLDNIQSHKLYNYNNVISSCFAANSIPEIFENLNNFLKTTKSQLEINFIEKTINTLKAKSPASLAITLQALRIAKKLDFNQCMELEYKIALGFLSNNDFYEGIRAQVIDKDNKPQWDAFDFENANKYFKEYGLPSKKLVA